MTRHAKLLTDSRYREHTAFWKDQLSALDDAFHFRQTWHAYALAGGDQFETTIDLDTHGHGFLIDWCAGNDLAAFVTVLAAINHSLHLYTGAATVCVNSPLLRAGSRSEFDSTVPLIGRVDRSLTVQGYLDHLRQSVAQTYTYQDFPIACVWETLFGRNSQPATNVLVWSPGIHDALKDLTLYDLVVEIRPLPRLGIRLGGNPSSFSRPFLDRFGQHVSNLLAGYKDMRRPLSDVSAINENERRRLLYDNNQTGRHLAIDQTIVQLFYARAGELPTNIALKAGARTMSYEELNQASNRLAWFLRDEMGVQTGSVVGLFFERSELSVIGLLAILKAGAVYLPLDIEYPSDRLKFMIEDACVRGLLVYSDHFPLLTDFTTIPMFALDLQLTTLSTPATDIEPLISSYEPAYIIYTSGSTGKPKGVVVEHRSFVNTALHHIEAFDVEPNDILSQFYSASFDSSLFEIFVALLSGAALVIVEKAAISDPEQFGRIVESQKVTMLTVPPIYLATLDRGKLGSVTKIVSAGDNPRLEDARELAKTRSYFNSYGPTETSVCVTHYRLDPDVSYGSRLPIGKPISNVSIYVLDQELRLTPEGCIGEICIGGAALARCYLNRDDISAQAFVGNPFVPGERLYRTGDLGIWLPDGNLEMVGRKDSQVKIRGYRIELGEIELALGGHPNVKESIALAREEKPGDKRLIAYVTLARPTPVAELRNYLKNLLPDFMIPSSFVVMAKMPLTANGKIDRKLLPAPQAVQESSKHRAPQSEVESQLADIWKEVLGIRQVGVDDNFFELGGDSILIIQMVSRTLKRGLKITPQQVFDHQTISGLAGVAGMAERGNTRDAEQELISGPLIMLPMQEWFFSQALEDRNHYNQSVMLAVPSNLDVGYLETSLRKLIEHHDALRARFTFDRERWTQEIAAGQDPVPFSVADLSGFSASERQAELDRAAARLQRSLDIANGPLIRVQLLRLDDSDSRLLFVIHHLAVDGVSWRLLLEDFYSAYQQQVHGESVQMAPKTTSLREWGWSLKEYAGGLGAEFDYWADESRRRIQQLPADHTGESNTLSSVDQLELELTTVETQSLLQEAPRAYNTQINDILLTALGLTLKEWTGQHEFLVDCEAHGREDLFPGVDLSRTTGWLTAIYPALLRIEGSNLGESLTAIKERLRRTPHHGIGYGLLRYLTGDHRGTVLASLPQAEIVFNYLGQADRIFSSDAGWRPIAGANGGERGASGLRSHLFEVTAIVVAGQLRISWEYSRNIHCRQTVERLAMVCLENLRALIAHCCSIGTSGYTPSDFPAARVDQKTLDALLSRMDPQ